MKKILLLSATFFLTGCMSTSLPYSHHRGYIDHHYDNYKELYTGNYVQVEEHPCNPDGNMALIIVDDKMIVDMYTKVSKGAMRSKWEIDSISDEFVLTKSSRYQLEFKIIGNKVIGTFEDTNVCSWTFELKKRRI